MNRSELVQFLRQHRYAVQATRSPEGAPQAAVVGIAVTDELEIVFDTLASTRKLQNLRRDPRIAFVVGCEDERSAQLEGVADEPSGAELERLQRCYFEAFPDGPTRLEWPGISYVRVRVHWARYSDFNPETYQVVEVELGSPQ
jgi:general stress protein 26